MRLIERPAGGSCKSLSVAGGFYPCLRPSKVGRRTHGLKTRATVSTARCPPNHLVIAVALVTLLLSPLSALARGDIFSLKTDPATAAIPFLSWDTENGPRPQTNLLRAPTQAIGGRRWIFSD